MLFGSIVVFQIFLNILSDTVGYLAMYGGTQLPIHQAKENILRPVRKWAVRVKLDPKQKWEGRCDSLD